MTIKVIACRAASATDLLVEMLRLRYRVFKERLDWSVSVVGDLEVDSFDARDPTYLVLVGVEMEVLGCVRLLPSEGPNMLADNFPILLGGREMPRSPRIWESSRFCVDTERFKVVLPSGLRAATPTLFAGMVELGLARGLTAIATVTDARMERILQRSGWPLRRYADPCQIGSTLAVAGELEVSQEALERIRRHGGLEGAVLVDREEMLESERAA